MNASDLPHSREAEEHLLSCCLLDASEVLSKCANSAIFEGYFYDAKHGVIFAAAHRLWTRGTLVDVGTVAEELRATNQLDGIGGYAFLVEVSKRNPSSAQAGFYIEQVRQLYLRREMIRKSSATIEACHSFNGGDIDEFIEAAARRIDAVKESNFGGMTVVQRYANRRAGFGRTIPVQAPVVLLGGTPIFTRGNISTITAQKKEGKSAACGAILGAIIGDPEHLRETLGFTGHNLDCHAVIHFDTEQSPEDHEKLVATARTRANLAETPSWLYSYGVKGMGLEELNHMLSRLVREASKAHGGVCVVLLDGVADFVSDPNKPEVCNPFVTVLEGIAASYNCAVICALHLNPAPAGQPSKSRGHLGSQLERKCESDLRLVKDKDGNTTMFLACARRAPIFEQDGPRFSWDTSAGMHTLLGQTKGEVKKSAKALAVQALAEEVFGDRSAMRYTDLINAIKSTCKCCERTADRRFTAMGEHQVIKKSPLKQWVLNVL